MMRFLRRLADKDLALDRAMIPLGSCTMKLNAAAEMMPVSWPSVANLHPFAPAAHAAGYRAMIDDLERWLAEITGFDARLAAAQCRQPGRICRAARDPPLPRLARRGNRNVCLIPSSAHGTNPASASMAGMRVVVVACEEAGDIDVDDLKAKAAEHAANLAALMITYPSTHGVFEEGVRDICALVHRAWRAGLSRRRQPQRAGRAGAARRHRRRRLPHEPAQDLLHPAWRRRTRRRPDRRQGASAAVPAGPCQLKAPRTR